MESTRQIKQKIFWNLNTCLTRKGFYSCAIDSLVDTYCHVFDEFCNEINANWELGKILKSIIEMKSSLKSRNDWSKLREKIWDYACLKYPNDFVAKGRVDASLDILIRDVFG